MYVERYFVVPPGNEGKLKSYGLMTLTILNFITTKNYPTDRLAFRICIWGSSTQQLFLQTASGHHQATYRIATNYQLLMRYLNDMGTFVIEALDSRNTKKIGSVFVNLKRFQTLSGRQELIVANFTEKFDMISAAKDKIGEISLCFDVNFQAYADIKNIGDIGQPVIILQPEQYHAIPNQPTLPIINPTNPLAPTNPTNVISPIVNQPTVIKKHKQNQTDFVNAPLPIPYIMNYSLTLYIMKLQQDYAMLFGNQQPPKHQQSPYFIELAIEFIHVKFQQRTLRPVDRLTIVYPNQPDQHKPLTVITTILNSLKSSASSSLFNQSISLKVPSAEHNIEIFCGDGVASYPLSKFLDGNHSDLRLFLNKKDNTRYGYVLCRPVLKYPEYNMLMYIGEYNFSQPGEYVLKINSKSKETKVLKPLNYKKFYCKLLYEKVSNPEVMVVEVWKREQDSEKLCGLVRMDVNEGIEDKRWIVKTVVGEQVGWVRIIHRLADRQQVTLFNEELDRQIRAGSIDYQVPSGGTTSPLNPVSPNIPSNPQVQPPPQPAPDPKPQPPPSTHYSSFLYVYIKILYDMKKCKEPTCKKLTDLFLSKESITKEEFQSLLQLTTKQLLGPFLPRFDFPLAFDSFMNSYLRYSFYERKIRLSLEYLLDRIYKCTNVDNIKIKKLTPCFGYVQSSELVDVLVDAGITRQDAQYLCKYVYSNNKKEVFLDEFKYILKGQSETVGCFVFCQFVLAYLSKVYSMEDLEEEVRKFSDGQGTLTHFYDCVLDKMAREAELLLMEEYRNKYVPYVPPEPVPLPPNEPINPPCPPVPPIRPVDPPAKKIEVTLHSIYCDIDNLTDIIISPDICIHMNELPISFLLAELQYTTMRIHTKYGLTLYAYFVPQQILRKTKLYCRNKYVGTVFFGYAEDRYVLVEITKKPSNKQPNIVPAVQEIKHEYPPIVMKYLPTYLINIEILSIIPTTAYQVTAYSFQLKYPLEYHVTLRNTSNTIPLQVSNTSSGFCTIHMSEGITKYAVNKNDGSLLCILELRITPEYQQPKLINSKKCLFAYLYRIDDFGSDVPAEFTILIDCNGQLTKSTRIKKNSISTMVHSTFILQYCHRYRLEIMNSPIEFQFVVKFHGYLGIFRHEGYLRSHNSRLSLIIYEVNYNDDFSMMKNGQQKMYKIWKLFTPYTLKLLESATYDKLINTLKFTHSYLHVFQSLRKDVVLNNHLTPYVSPNNTKLCLQKMHDYFNLYDFYENGEIKKEKAELVYGLIRSDDSPMVECNLQLVDLNANDKVDYYYILRQYEMVDESDRYFWQKDEPVRSAIIVGKYVRISILAYEDLVVRGMPGTYLFEVDGKKISYPIPRSYSHKYSEPCPMVVARLPCKLKVYNKEYGMVELWKYVEVAEAALEERTKIIGGTVYFRIEEVGSNGIGTGNVPNIPNVPNAPNIPSQPNSPSKITPQPTMYPRRAIPLSFPTITPIKSYPKPGPIKKYDDPNRKTQMYKFKKIMNEYIDLSKYNFDDSDDD